MLSISLLLIDYIRVQYARRVIVSCPAIQLANIMSDNKLKIITTADLILKYSYCLV